MSSEALQGRDMEDAKNTPELLAEHQAINGQIVRTRFPPEPNGFLHIGHAKSMNMNFNLAFEKLGVAPENRRTVFRYDDTNPEAESKEFIESLRNDVAWMGWKPERTTYSSDNFQKLYELALELIQKGLAYVCHMTRDEVEAQRALAKSTVAARNNNKPLPPTNPALIPGPYRNRTVEENLKLFDDMKLGKIDEGICTLRLKMDFDSNNPNMYDLVAYRVKFHPHPHAGDGWCIYPSYDYTHGTCDSLEHVDYSICTLEFETRRENYFWLLQKMGIFRPKVFEMSRLNIEYTVLSKRRLLKLVTGKFVRGWDDPRMPTISGMRRRGYPSGAINSFCDDVGVSRSTNLIEFGRLSQHIRMGLADTARRCMAVLSPIRCDITNFADVAEANVLDVPNFPQAPEKGTHKVTFTPVIYIDSNDFRDVDDKNFFGLVPGGKVAGLKYANCKIICDSIEKDQNGKVASLKCRLLKADEGAKPKSYLTWVGSGGVKCEVRKYGHLFTVPEPTENWEDELNLDSEIVIKDAMVDESVLTCCVTKDKWDSNPSFQFERVGYYVVDDDSKDGALVFNETVGLREDSGKKESKKVDSAAQAKKDAQNEARRKREERNKLTEEEFFQKAEEFQGLYSKFDETGFPTHDKEGKELTKSAVKKLKKELEKHKKARAKG